VRHATAVEPPSFSKSRRETAVGALGGIDLRAEILSRESFSNFNHAYVGWSARRQLRDARIGGNSLFGWGQTLTRKVSQRDIYFRRDFGVLFLEMGPRGLHPLRPSESFAAAGGCGENRMFRSSNLSGKKGIDWLT
jgi:hypothetical protein